MIQRDGTHEIKIIELSPGIFRRRVKALFNFLVKELFNESHILGSKIGQMNAEYNKIVGIERKKN